MRHQAIDPIFEPLPVPQHPEACRLYEYWLGKRGIKEMPNRDAMQLDELTSLHCVDRVFIMEPLAGNDWRYRLLGTEIVKRFGRDVTGIPFRAHMAKDEAETAIQISNAAAEARKPVFLQARFTSGKHHRIVETMSLPIRSRDGKEVWLFGGTFFYTLTEERDPPRSGQRRPKSRTQKVPYARLRA